MIIVSKKNILSFLDGWLVGDGVGLGEIHEGNGITSKENCYARCVEEK